MQGQEGKNFIQQLLVSRGVAKMYEPLRDKTQQKKKCPVKTQISLGICSVWSDWASDQTGRMPRLICVLAGRTGHFVGFVKRGLVFENKYIPVC